MEAGWLSLPRGCLDDIKAALSEYGVNLTVDEKRFHGTVIAIAALAARKRNTLILVHRKPLLQQWRLQLSSLLGIDKKEIGLNVIIYDYVDAAVSVLANMHRKRLKTYKMLGYTVITEGEQFLPGI